MEAAVARNVLLAAKKQEAVPSRLARQRPIMPEQTALGEIKAFAVATQRRPPLSNHEPTNANSKAPEKMAMTTLNKTLTVICVILAVIYLSREEVTSAGPRNLGTRIHNRWTGSVVMCLGGECSQIYPPVSASGK
jgi:hypothetical protein